MKIEGPGKLLTITIGESDRWEGKPLYAAIVHRARELGVAGATVTRGIMGYGANSRIHTASVLRLSEDLPIIIQIVDRPDRIAMFVNELDGMIADGIAVTSDVVIERYKPG